MINESAEMSERKRVLYLFYGTKSVTRTLEELGYAVTTLDGRPDCKADFTVDIRSLKYWTTCRQGDFKIIWASILCTVFSQALTTRD